MFRNKVRAPELEEFGMRRNAKLPSLAKAMLSKLAEGSGMHVAVGFMPAFKCRQKNSLIVLERGHKAHGYVSAGDASKIPISCPPMTCGFPPLGPFNLGPARNQPDSGLPQRRSRTPVNNRSIPVHGCSSAFECGGGPSE